MTGKTRKQTRHVRDKTPKWNLQNLPPELLLRILFFLDSYYIIKILPLVCKTLNRVVNDNYTWKSRIALATDASFPCIPPPENFNWKKAVCTLETEAYRWKNNGLRMNKYPLKSAHYSFIHAIHLLQKGEICVSGSRDCALKFWNLERLTDPNNMNTADILIDINLNAHRGWIWSITSSGTQMCTGGWDAMVHLWNLDEGCQCLYSAKCKGAALCTAIYQNVVAAGTYNRRVSLFDMRRGMLPIKEKLPHTKAVLSVHMDDKYIISASEDATVSVFDRVADKVFTALTCPNYVISLSCNNGFLFGGDKRGAIHLWNMANGSFDFAHTFNVGHDGSMTGLCHNLGCIISGCTDRTVKVSSLSYPPALWATLEVDENVGDLHYLNGVLAVSSSDSIFVWKPKVA